MRDLAVPFLHVLATVARLVGAGCSITSGQSLPTYLSADHDPLYRFHQWQANLRILNIREIKTSKSPLILARTRKTGYFFRFVFAVAIFSREIGEFFWRGR